ncbi:hypothetical protein DFH27DRAFT_613518 [Peziza echinospora]|nr:hypothetical protein DFH27DRAFT_613518 [Peziza echinospora]
MAMNKAVWELVADCPKKTKETAKAREQADENNDNSKNMLVVPAKRRRTGTVRKVISKMDLGFQGRVMKLCAKVYHIQAVYNQEDTKYQADIPEDRGAMMGPIHAAVTGGNCLNYDVLEAMNLPEKNPEMWIHCCSGVRTLAVRLAFNTARAVEGSTYKDGLQAAVVVANAWKPANRLS